jgi:endonuclease/exonuclease/phosphatase family metal-dependent hydrolase
MKLIPIILLLTLWGCQKAPSSKMITAKKTEVTNPYLPVTQSDRVSIMQFNVENLFDTTHDIGKVDYTFLPFTVKQFKEHKQECDKLTNKKWKNQCLFLDWSKENLHQKMTALATAILKQNRGVGPDILVMEEVENISVLEEFRKKYLSKANYNPSILIEGKDARGIDVAILSKLPLKGSPSLHYVSFSNIPENERKDTRPILEATFELPNKDLMTVFAVHFPAPYHPMIFRKESFIFLNQLLLKIPKNNYAIAIGDFNVTTAEREKHHILKNNVTDYWIVAHDQKKMNEPGSQYYKPKKSWSFLDMILLNKKFSNPNSNWQPDYATLKVANDYKGQNKMDEGIKVPNGYNIQNGAGVSDHWPLYIELTLKK